MKFSVIYTPESGHIETFGPFISIKDAREWMADDFNYNYDVAKRAGVDAQWTWTERNHQTLGSCKIEGLGSWEIIRLYN